MTQHYLHPDTDQLLLDRPGFDQACIEAAARALQRDRKAPAEFAITHDYGPPCGGEWISVGVSTAASTRAGFAISATLTIAGPEFNGTEYDVLSFKAVAG